MLTPMLPNTDSVFLHEFVFPNKTVLVLGAEREGVPVEILQVPFWISVMRIDVHAFSTQR
jgi:hypothetical protein